MTAAVALRAALRAKARAEFAHRTHTTPWCGVDRCGERHVLDLSFADRAAAARLLVDLDDHEFELPDDLVADIEAHIREDQANGAIALTIEALTFPFD